MTLSATCSIFHETIHMTDKNNVKNIPESVHDFAREIRKNAPVRVEAAYVVGSLLTPDYQPALSDINTLLIVPGHNLAFLDFLIGLSHDLKEQGFAPPLIMSEEYVYRSLDVFPMEFLNFREIHHVLFGPDILAHLVIESEPLRMQCEREIKARLLWLHQIYLETKASEELLAPQLIESITGYFPIMRALHVLAGHQPPVAEKELIAGIQELLDLDDDIFLRLRTLKRQLKTWPNRQALVADYQSLYKAARKIAHYVDTLAD